MFTFQCKQTESPVRLTSVKYKVVAITSVPIITRMQEVELGNGTQNDE